MEQERGVRLWHKYDQLLLNVNTEAFKTGQDVERDKKREGRGVNSDVGWH